MIMVIIMTETKKLKNLVGNIYKHGWKYSRWEFSGAEFTMGSLIGVIFWVGVFLIPLLT